jgi:hypothetical protein
MNIDEMVRQTLHSYADDAPPNAGLLDAAQVRARQRRVRRAGVTVAAAVAAVLVSLSIPFGAPLGGTGPDTVGAGPPPVDLVEPSFDLPSFPLTPRWVPDGIEQPYVTRPHRSIQGGDDVVEYYGSDGLMSEAEERELEARIFPVMSLIHPTRPNEFIPPLEMSVYLAEPSIGDVEPPDGEPTTVLGRPGILYVGDEGHTIVVWQHDPDQWMRLWAASEFSLADVEQYLQGLEETPLPGPAPFTFGLLPAGADLVGLGAATMKFEMPDGGWLWLELDWDEKTVGPILVSPPPPSTDPSTEPSPDSSPEPTPPGPSGEPQPIPIPIEVDGRPAELTEWSDGTGTGVSIYLDQHWVLSVGGTLNRADLLRVAEGVDLTPLARPFGVPSQPR